MNIKKIIVILIILLTTTIAHSQQAGIDIPSLPNGVSYLGPSTLFPVSENGYTYRIQLSDITGYFSSSGMVNPMSVLGSTIYQGVSGPAALFGNTSILRKFYTQTGTGTVSSAPSWNFINASDLPFSIGNLTVDPNLSITGGSNAVMGSGAYIGLGPNVPTSIVVTSEPNLSASIISNVLYLQGYGLFADARIASASNWNDAYTRRVTTWSSPLTFSNGTAGINQATGSTSGYLSATNWNTFNNKQNALNFSNSVVLTGSTVALSNDSGAPGGSQYYGTNPSGTKGYYPLPIIQSVPANAFYNNLRIRVSSATTISVTSDHVGLIDVNTGIPVSVGPISLTINTAIVGAGGLDIGSMATSTWYAVWIIYNSTTAQTAGLISTSATFPTLPSGYTAKGRFGWEITSTQSANPTALSPIIQYGRSARYVVDGTYNTHLPLLASGTAGNVSTPTWQAVSTNFWIPSTASKIIMAPYAVGSYVLIVAPNLNYGGYSSTTNPPPVCMGGPHAGMLTEMMLENSTWIYWASNGSTNAIYVYGWEDNL